MITNRPVVGSNKVPKVLAERYEIGKKLGSGHFGTVYLCKDKEENEKKFVFNDSIINFALYSTSFTCFWSFLITFCTLCF